MKAIEKLDKSKLLEATIKDIQDKYGEGAIMMLGEARKVDVDVIPTGAFALDVALGVGGVPRGRIIEIFGPESSGKTTLALHIVREAQKKAVEKVMRGEISDGQTCVALLKAYQHITSR